MSLFGAAWTVGSLNSLFSAGAASATYYEATGWRGLMEFATGNPLPEAFSSRPGMIFPIYWILEFLSEANGGNLLALASENPMLVQGLAVKKGERLWVVVSNLQPRASHVMVTPPFRGTAAMRRLNEISMDADYHSPKDFRANNETIAVDETGIVLRLAPYETVFIEQSGLNEQSDPVRQVGPTM